MFQCWSTHTVIWEFNWWKYTWKKNLIFMIFKSVNTLKSFVCPLLSGLLDNLCNWGVMVLDSPCWWSLPHAMQCQKEHFKDQMYSPLNNNYTKSDHEAWFLFSIITASAVIHTVYQSLVILISQNPLCIYSKMFLNMHLQVSSNFEVKFSLFSYLVLFIHVKKNTAIHMLSMQLSCIVIFCTIICK